MGSFNNMTHIPCGALNTSRFVLLVLGASTIKKMVPIGNFANFPLCLPQTLPACGRNEWRWTHNQEFTVWE